MENLSFDQTQTFPVQLQVPMSYHYFSGAAGHHSDGAAGPQSNGASGKPLLIFLHGFADSASSFLKRALPELHPDFEILAPNGPFPTPQLVQGEWKAAFSWYFIDFATGKVLVSPSVAADAIAQLLRKLGLEDRPKILVGFSQGGFFIPYLLPFLKNVRHAVGIGASYRLENYPSTLNIAVDAIHGEDDTVVTYEKSAESFKALQKLNPRGEYFPIQGLGHKMNDEARAILLRQIQKVII